MTSRDGGFSKARRGRMREVMASHVGRGGIHLDFWTLAYQAIDD